MNTRNGLLGALLVGLAGSAMAGDDANMTMVVDVAGEDGVDGRHFRINSDDLGFDLDEMQVGESRSIVDESGQAILITRGEEGFSVNIDGKTIELPKLHGVEHGGMQWMGDGGESDIDVHVMRDINVTRTKEMSGTMIMSPKPIDDATQQAIKVLLESAGYGDDVKFINHDDAEHGRVMIKTVERVAESP
jgi:hypothetical protein